MVQRGGTVRSRGQQLVDQPIVEVEPGRVGFARSCGEILGHEIEKRYAPTPIDFNSATS